MTVSLERIVETLPAGFSELELTQKANGHRHMTRLAVEFTNNRAMFSRVTAHAGNDGAARFWEAIGFSRVKGQPWSHEAVVLTVESASGPIHEVAERFVEVRSVWQDRPDMLRLSSSQF